MHPVRVQIEIEVGREIMKYIFGSQREQKDGKKTKQKQIEDGKASKEKNGKSQAQRQNLLRSTLQRAQESTDNLPSSESRRSSVQSERDANSRLKSSDSNESLRSSSGNGHAFAAWVPSGELPNDEARAIAVRHGTEMRKRAARHKTFVYVKVPPTVFCLSYKVGCMCPLSHG